MEDDASPPSLFDVPRVPGRFINPRCIVHEAGGLRVAVVAGYPFHTWAIGDVAAENLFVVQARQADVATIEELAVALERPERTLHHAFRQYTKGGVDAVRPRKRGPVPGESRDILRDATIRRLHAGGEWNRAIAEKLACSPFTVTRALKRMGLEPNRLNQRRLIPTPPAAPENPAAASEPETPTAPSELGTPTASENPAATASEPETPTAPFELETATAPENPAAAASEPEAPTTPFELETPTAPENPTAAASEPEAPTTPESPMAAAPSESETPTTPENLADTAPSEPEAASPRQGPADAHVLATVPRTLDRDPLNRCMDRFRATQGVLTDAVPLFLSGNNLLYVGVLLAIPGLVRSGLLEDARRLYTKEAPAFYGLRTSLTTIVLLALLRFKRPEHLKEVSPAALGRVIGLDRAPEVKTLRRMIHRLAAGPFEELLLSVTRRRVEATQEALGWLYVDGHVRVYTGKERLPMAHVTRMRISAPATQDMWVHDGDGRPLLFVTQEAHPSLAQALPPLLESARELTGDRRVTIVFDRGGWSPALFAELDELGADVLTYRKGTWDPIPVTAFSPCPGRPGEPEWLLHDASIHLPNGLSMRQITRLVGEHQTAIVTTRRDLPAHVLARRMFDRWRQENFFKYMRQEFDLDGLIEYGAQDEDPQREVPNPVWTRRDKALRAARLLLRNRLAHRVNRDHAEVIEAAAQVDELRQQRNAVARRVTVGELEQKTVRLPSRAKNLYDGLKTLAWQLETDLFHAVAPHYRRVEDEGRTLITSAFRSAGSLEVTPDELVVTLAPQSSPHRTRAIAELCNLLDQTETRFPGTQLRLRYRIEGAANGRRGAPLAPKTAT